MPLSREQVEKVALLARLKFTPEELGRFASQLSPIIAYVEQLGELQTDGVEPMSHPIELRNVFRDDIQLGSLPRDAALANAPGRDDEFFLVPPVLD